MINEFKEMCAKGVYPNHYLEKACTLFKIAKNAEKKEKDGIFPALKNLSILNELESFDTFSNMYKSLMFNQLPLPFQIMVETDMKNTKNIVYVFKVQALFYPMLHIIKKKWRNKKKCF